MRKIERFLLLCCCFVFVAPMRGQTEAVPEDVTQFAVRFTYGLNGSAKTEKTFFAGESIFWRIEIPKSLAPDTSIDLFFEMVFVSQSNKNQKIVNSQPIHVRDHSFSQKPFYYQFNVTPPPEFEPGKYDLQILMRNRQGKIVGEGKETIDLLPASAFGIRGLGFIRRVSVSGKIMEIFGSNIFVAGENAAIRFEIGGLSPNDNENLEAIISIIQTEEEGDSVNITQLDPSALLKMKVSLFDPPKPIPYSKPFSVTQPGNYTLKIEVKDMNSQKTDTVELPVRVLEPVDEIQQTK